MRTTYARIWWSFLFRGTLALLFGLAAILLPGITLDVLIILVGAFFFADGLLAIIASLHTRRTDQRWWLALVEGGAGVTIGILTFFWPQATLIAVIFLIAFWALITGLVEIIAAYYLREIISNEWFLGLGGVLSILVGLILLFNPKIGAIALVWILGGYAILFGILLIFLGYKLKQLLREDDSPPI